VQARDGTALIDAALQRQSLGDTALIIYTSGSTGKPKGAMISYGNIAAWCRASSSGWARRRHHAPVVPAAVPRGRTDAHGLRAGVPGLAGELRRIDPHRAGRPARSRAHHVPRRAAHLGKAACGHQHQDAGNRAPATRPVQPGHAACAALAEKPRGSWTLAERGTFALAYWLVLRALQNFIGLRARASRSPARRRSQPDVVRFFRTLGVPLVEVYGLTESSGMVAGPPQQ
jgi:long-chain acyl-CoA synthetase